MTAALEVPYATRNVEALSPDIDAILTIAPRVSFNAGITAWLQRKTPQARLRTRN